MAAKKKSTGSSGSSSKPLSGYETSAAKKVANQRKNTAVGVAGWSAKEMGYTSQIREGNFPLKKIPQSTVDNAMNVASRKFDMQRAYKEVLNGPTPTSGHGASEKKKKK